MDARFYGGTGTADNFLIVAVLTKMDTRSYVQRFPHADDRVGVAVLTKMDARSYF